MTSSNSTYGRVKNPQASRVSFRLAAAIRKEISSGKMAAGDLLPSERTLAKTYGCSVTSVRRATKWLAAESLIRAEARRGYRILSRAHEMGKGFPLAFIATSPVRPDSSFYNNILGALQTAAGRRGWALLGIVRNGRGTDEIVEHLRASRSCGVIVDSCDAEMLAQIRHLGLPAVMVDSWLPDMPLDAVVQDGSSGAMVAADYLVSRGHRRVGYVGLRVADGNPQVVERFNGAVGGLARSGIDLPPELRLETTGDDLDLLASPVRDLLRRPDRPTAILAPWQGLCWVVARVAVELGLNLGRDLDLIGWSPEEEYASSFVPLFAPDAAPPVMVWSMRDMAELCMMRLEDRRRHPDLPVSVTRVPVRLRMPGSGPAGRDRQP